MLFCQGVWILLRQDIYYQSPWLRRGFKKNCLNCRKNRWATAQHFPCLRAIRSAGGPAQSDPMTVHTRTECSSSALLFPLITPSSLRSAASSPRSIIPTSTQMASSASTSSSTSGPQPTPSRKYCSPSPVSSRMPTTKTPSCLKSRNCTRKAQASSQRWPRSGRKNMRNDINKASFTSTMMRSVRVCTIFENRQRMGYVYRFCLFVKRHNINQDYLNIIMIEKILLYGAIILWGALSMFAFRNVTKIIKKYRNVRLVEPDEKWSATIRTDFNQWDERAMKIGCFLRFPYKIIAMLSILIGISLIIYFQPVLKKVNKNIDRLFAKAIARRLAGLVYHIDDQQAVEKIQTPIIISNHVNWFDVGYLLTYYFPSSFVSKAEVQSAPLVGRVASYVQCVFLERQSATAREATLNKIRDRVEAYSKDPVNVNPLIIFPQGTTSNGRSIMKFKIGAFNDLAPITIFGLKYTCAGLDMGMQEITAIQHIILTLTLQPKLTVTSRQVSAKEGESPEQYMLRCQAQLSNLTSFPIYQTGVKEKIELKQLREGRKTE